jgi:hypothetical protein
MPELRRRHPADRVQTVLPVRNHPWPSHCWQPPVAADILLASRGRSGRSSRLWANRSSHHRCHRLVAHLPTGASSCRRTTIGHSSKRRLTNCPRSTFTASERRRTRGVEAPGTVNWDAVCAEARKTPPKGVRGARGNGPEPPGMPALGAYEQSVSPETVAELPLTGLTCGELAATGPSRPECPLSVLMSSPSVPSPSQKCH